MKCSECKLEECSCGLAAAVIKTLNIVERKLILNPDGSPYLERIVLTRTPNTYLHVIYSSDADRDFHDHPWDFKSTIVWGSYIETQLVCAGHDSIEDGVCLTCGNPPKKEIKRRYSAGMTNIKQASDVHQLTLEKGPVVTLFESGPIVRDWGFVTEKGWVHHDRYLKEMKS